MSGADERRAAPSAAPYACRQCDIVLTPDTAEVALAAPTGVDLGHRPLSDLLIAHRRESKVSNNLTRPRRSPTTKRRQASPRRRTRSLWAPSERDWLSQPVIDYDARAAMARPPPQNHPAPAAAVAAGGIRGTAMECPAATTRHLAPSAAYTGRAFIGFDRLRHHRWHHRLRRPCRRPLRPRLRLTHPLQSGQPRSARPRPRGDAPASLSRPVTFIPDGTVAIQSSRSEQPYALGTGWAGRNSGRPSYRRKPQPVGASCIVNGRRQASSSGITFADDQSRRSAGPTGGRWRKCAIRVTLDEPWLHPSR